MALFGTKAWVDEYGKNLNASKAYEDAAKTWEGDFVFVVKADGNQKTDLYMYLDLWHGKARSWAILKSPDEKKAEFIYEGPYSNFKLLAQKKIDPIQGLMTGKFKLKGNMGKVMRAVKAAQELVNTIVATDTQFV
jgi:putative sterol carrier protein